MGNDLSADKTESLGALTDRLAGLSPAKRRLLELRLKEQRADDRRRPTIPRLADRSAIPLSFAQQRLWFFDQLEPGSSVYNNPSVLRLRGRLDAAALERTLNEILRRHEVLRTSFTLLEGEPVQVIDEHATLTLPVLDLRNIPSRERETEARRLAAEEIRRPFVLSKAPLFRAILLKLDSEDHILAMTVHHIASDGWSSRIFGREISALYEAFRAGRPSPLSELPVQYADFAAWQRQWLRGEVLEKQLSYWKKQLEGLSTLDLPTDRPRPAVQTFRGAKQSLALSKALNEALGSLSRQEGVTLFMTLLSAFTILLQRHTGQDDIVIGAPIAGRNHSEIEDLIGFFVNTLVLRTDLSGNPTFRELLARVRGMALDAYARQDLPFEKLVEELQPERDLSRTPLFQVFFNMLGLEARELRLQDLAMERLILSEPEAKFDFTLYIRGGNREIRFEMVYNTDLFRQDRIIEMLEQFKGLLAQIVENPDAKIAQFSLVTSKAKAALPDPTEMLHREWPGAIPARFSRQAERTPDRAAVLSKGENWSYKELESRSNQIAHYLLSNGIRPGDIVAIYAGRSAALVSALLGILKAGAAFLILDPSYPAARLIHYLLAAKPRGWIVLEEAGAPPDELEDFVSTLPRVCRLTLSQSVQGAARQDLLSEHPETAPGVPVNPDHRAYVAFTSGTSGAPKAIEGTHSPLSHFLKWHCETFDLDESDRFSMLSGLSHDPLLRDIFTPLWSGATLCIPDLEKMSPAELAGWIKQHEVSVVHLTPAMSEVLAEGAATAGSNVSLRYLFFGGDILNEMHITKMKQFAPRATCVNFFGATETPQAMGYFVVPGRNDDFHIVSEGSKRPVPLGRGIEGAQLLVLNRAGQLAGVGELGEIYVRTPYLARGYIEDEKLTRDRFPLNPCTGVNGDRVYRTGDMGRYLPDGTVEFAGRNDRQVKIRGFRIELGEIEAALMEHPIVQTAVVVAAANAAGDRRLVAYVACKTEEKPTGRELRKFLMRTLPEHMIPAAYVALDAFPLTPNGKVDRKALPDPDGLLLEGGEDYVAPGTTMERVIAEAWQEVLGVNHVGVQDNFFDLGGHSLLSMKVIRRIEEKTGQRIHPREMVYQTLGQLAAACEQRAPANRRDAPKGLSGRLLEAVKGMLNRS